MKKILFSENLEKMKSLRSLPIFILMLGFQLIACGKKENPSQATILESLVDEIRPTPENAIEFPYEYLSYLRKLQPRVQLFSMAYRQFQGDTNIYQLFPDTMYPISENRTLLLLRCIPGEEPCSHAEAAYFQLVMYSEDDDSINVLKESDLLPVHSPWCDKLTPRIFTIKGVPHLLFEMHDSHQEFWREQYWMISAGERNFGALVWEEEIYTKGLKEGKMDTIGVFPVEEMEAKVEFDTTRCSEGIWVMNISKTTTESLSNASIGDPSPESQEVVDSFEPVVKEDIIKKMFRMNRDGKLIKW